jgi:hypothetical protein
MSTYLVLPVYMAFYLPFWPQFLSQIASVWDNLGKKFDVTSIKIQ